MICFTEMDNGNLEHISHNLDVMLNSIIGPEVFINVRRATTNLADDIIRIKSEIEDSESVRVYSGSKAEGLRFKSSDDDWMLIYRKIKVIPSDSYRTIYDRNTTLLLMENEMTKPGFTLLRLIGESTNQEVRRSKEHIMNGCYLSCKRWRELHVRNSEFIHGPCASTLLFGTFECDLAHCLRCDIWPANARDCIRRLNQSPWPSHDTILSIVNDGVLFVPIGAKLSIFENTEWRMSFSLAEKKLVHALSHTQFLCYGLLKIFLKEAIDVNPDVKGLLCSYFLKTALFWEITTTTNKWNPSKLLSCFWNCFLRLLQWVSCSYCPNFFVPQNNMFAGKIEGRNREKLLQHLRILHCEGYSCLLRCQSLADGMSLIFMHPNGKLRLNEVDEVIIAHEIIRECNKYIPFGLNNTSISTVIKSILTQQIGSPTSSHEKFLLKTWLHEHLTEYSFSDTSSSAAGGCNKSHYHSITRRMNIVRRCQTDSISPILYQAMLCHNNMRYTCALRLVQRSKEKVLDHLLLKQDRETSSDHLPIIKLLRRHYTTMIQIQNDQFIPELYLENFSKQAENARLGVPITPRVCAFFLQFLCHRKLCHLREADDALYNLTLLVQHDDTQHQTSSWHILGVCQQISGDYKAACRSFMKVQQQKKFKEWFKFATCVRLGIILVKYF